jgi:hypothetical protein
VNEWESLHPRDATDILRSLDAPWWIAGGWSLDLFLGTQLRPHKYLDPGHERDWDAVVPQLDETARGWLAGAVATAHPESPYLGRL